MKKPMVSLCHYFVDESGDPTFYNGKGKLILNTEGVSPILIMGFIKTTDPKSLRKALADLRIEISNDKYLKDIPSIQSTLKIFHAKDDCPEVREKVFKTISSLDFSAEFFVARKKESIFTNKHKRRESIFYDDLISHLFENKLHLAEQNNITFAVRGSRTRQQPLELAINEAVRRFEQKWGVKTSTINSVQPHNPEGEPCLQVIDYLNWAVYRAFTKSEMRYFNFIEDKVSYLVDIYDLDKYPKNFYSRKNKFDITKISPL